MSKKEIERFDGTEWEVVKYLDKPINKDTLEERLEEGFEECKEACLQAIFGLTNDIKDEGYSFLIEHLLKGVKPILGVVKLEDSVYIYLTTNLEEDYTFVARLKYPKYEFSL